MKSPYIHLPMGGDKAPFDLNAPGVVLEIKRALIALAQRGSDPMYGPDPIKEDAWKNIVTEGDYAPGWDGPTADEFVFMLSRYKNYIDGPYIQSTSATVGIIGGPQPLARGLEVLASALHNVLGDYPRLDKYMAWRDSGFDPPSTWAVDETDPVTFCVFPGAPWNPLGYTPIWGSGPAGEAAVAAGQSYDSLLYTAWNSALNATNETERAFIYEQIKTARRLHDQLARVANQGAPPPSCGESWEWNPKTGMCEKKPVVITLPPTVIDVGEEEESKASAVFPIAATLLLGGIGALAIWSYRTSNLPDWLKLGNWR